MIEREVVIANKLGLHARAAARFVQTASQFEARILVERDGEQVNGKSIMGILMLAAARGTRIAIRAEGPDAEQAVDSLTRLIDERFGEGE